MTRRLLKLVAFLFALWDVFKPPRRKPRRIY